MIAERVGTAVQRHCAPDGQHRPGHRDRRRPDHGHPDQLAPGHAKRPQGRGLGRLQDDLAAECLAHQQQGGEGSQDRKPG
jgi:hypothetical protein